MTRRGMSRRSIAAVSATDRLSGAVSEAGRALREIRGPSGLPSISIGVSWIFTTDQG